MLSRRRLLKNSAALSAALVLPKWGRTAGFKSANARPKIAAIGTGSRWYQKATGRDGTYGSAPSMQKFGDYVAVCDADSDRVERAGKIVAGWTGADPMTTSDYRRVIDREDIDIVSHFDARSLARQNCDRSVAFGQRRLL